MVSLALVIAFILGVAVGFIVKPKPITITLNRNFDDKTVRPEPKVLKEAEFNELNGIEDVTKAMKETMNEFGGV